MKATLGGPHNPATACSNIESRALNLRNEELPSDDANQYTLSDEISMSENTEQLIIKAH